MTKTFFSYSFGCRVNEAEKEEIDRQMLKAGYIYSEANPGVYIINTCSVTQKAEREARQHIYQIRKKYLHTKIVITGCSATYWKKNKLYQNLPVDQIIDNTQKEFLVSLLKKRLNTSRRNTLSNLSGYLGRYNSTNKYISSGRILIKIQDGCQRYCSFCIVPYLRGFPKSTPIRNIIYTINELEQGIKEVILTAINTEAYGYDTKESFNDLIRAVIKQTVVPRISFGSIHPWSINDKFYYLYKSLLPEKRLVDFFHIPLQSGSNKILSLMKRGYTREEFIEKLNILHSINPYALIGTDIIVGFLEETDKDFDDTYNFLKDSPISKFHVFRFSKRQNTAGWYMDKRLTEPNSTIKVKRAKILAELSQKKYGTFVNSLIGRTFDTLFLQNRVGEIQEGLLSNQIPIFVKTVKDMKKLIKNTEVIEYKKGRLFGKLV